MKWIDDGCDIEDDECENKSEVDFGDLYLVEMPKEGVKGLVTIKGHSI